MKPDNHRAMSMMILYALIAVLIAFCLFVVYYGAYDRIIKGGENMREGTMCNTILAITGSGGSRFSGLLGSAVGYVLPSAGACGKTVVVNPLKDRPSTPAQATADAVLNSLAEEVNKCWQRSRLAANTEFTCVHSFKFRLDGGTINECGLTYKLCTATFPEWKAVAPPGNTKADCGDGFTCPGGDNLWGPETINDRQVHSFRILYCNDKTENCSPEAVKVEKQY